MTTTPSSMFAKAVALILVLALSWTPCAGAEEAVNIDQLMTATYYDLLGLAPASATGRDIKRAYRALALRYHPDKLMTGGGANEVGDNDSEKLHQLFIRINLAHETLISDELREQYDFVLAHSDMVDYSADSYRRLRDEVQYGKAGAYAMRAMRGEIEWSELIVLTLSLMLFVGPVTYGYFTTYRKSVKKRSDREQRTKHENEERMKLIQQRAEQEEMLDRQRQLERERHRAANTNDNESDSDEDGEDEAKKREREERRQRNKRIRATFKSTVRLHVESSDDVELLLRSLTISEIEALQQSFESDSRAAVRSVRSRLDELAKQEETKQQPVVATASTTAKSSSDPASSRVRDWSLSEVSALARAMAKHPGGTSDRWEKITAIVNSVSDAQRRSVKEVLARVKYEEATKLLNGSSTASKTPVSDSTSASASASVGDGWNTVDQAALESALRSVPRTVDGDRWSLIAALVPGKTKSQCVRRFKEIQAQIATAKEAR